MAVFDVGFQCQQIETASRTEQTVNLRIKEKNKEKRKDDNEKKNERKKEGRDERTKAVKLWKEKMKELNYVRERKKKKKKKKKCQTAKDSNSYLWKKPV